MWSFPPYWFNGSVGIGRIRFVPCSSRFWSFSPCFPCWKAVQWFFSCKLPHTSKLEHWISCWRSSTSSPIPVNIFGTCLQLLSSALSTYKSPTMEMNKLWLVKWVDDCFKQHWRSYLGSRPSQRSAWGKHRYPSRKTSLLSAFETTPHGPGPTDLIIRNVSLNTVFHVPLVFSLIFICLSLLGERWTFVWTRDDVLHRILAIRVHTILSTVLSGYFSDVKISVSHITVPNDRQVVMRSRIHFLTRVRILPSHPLL